MQGKSLNYFKKFLKKVKHKRSLDKVKQCKDKGLVYFKEYFTFF